MLHPLLPHPVTWLRDRLADRRRKRAMATLLALDDHILDDLGLSRTEVARRIHGT